MLGAICLLVFVIWILFDMGAEFLRVSAARRVAARKLVTTVRASEAQATESASGE
jgi:hypothetical protein